MVCSKMLLVHFLKYRPVVGRLAHADRGCARIPRYILSPPVVVFFCFFPYLS